MSVSKEPRAAMEVLRIGDVIALADLEAGGFVIGDDVVSDELSLAQVEDPFLPALAPHELELAQFGIVPRFQYSAHGKLVQLLQSMPMPIPGMEKGGSLGWGERLQRVQNYVVSLESAASGNDLDPLSMDLCAHLQAFAAERDTNELELKRTTGRPVTYGNVVQLRHSRTGKFVTCTKRRAESNRLALRVSLVDDGDKGSWFRVMPSERVRCDGDGVRYCDQIQLCSVKFANIFLSVFQQIDSGPDPASPGLLGGKLWPATEGLGLSPRGQQKAPEHSPPRLRSDSIVKGVEVIACLEVNASAETHRFQVRRVRSWCSRHADYALEEDGQDAGAEFVSGLDVVTFTRASARVLLYGDPQTKSVWWAPAERIDRVDREAMGRNQRLSSVNTFWRVKPQLTDNGAERIRNNGARVLLQHVASGMYLHDSIGDAVLSSQVHSKHNVWLLTIADKEGGREFVMDGSVLWINEEKHAGHNERWLGISRRQRKLSNSLDHIHKALDGRDVSKLPGVHGVAIKSGSTPDDADALEVKLIARSEVCVVENILLCRAMLRNTLNVLFSTTCAPPPARPNARDGQEMAALQQADSPVSPATDAPTLQLTEQHKKSTMLVLTALSKFKKGARTRRQMSEEEVYYAKHPLHKAVGALLPKFERSLALLCRLCEWENGKAHMAHQNLLASLQVLDFAMDIISVVLERLQLLPNLLERHFKSLHGVYTLCHTLLEKACASNLVNKRDMMREFLPSVQGYLSKDLRSYAMILKICSDHSQLLNALDDGIFREQITLLKESRSADTLKVMIDTCHSDGEPVRKNQVRWTKLLLQDAPDLIPRMNLSDGNVSLRDGFLSEHGEGEMVALEYQLRMLELLSVLAQGRNADAIKEIESLGEEKGLSYAKLLVLMHTKSVPFSLRSLACQLLRVVYVDREPHQKIGQPPKARIWTGLHGHIGTADEHQFFRVPNADLSDLKRVLVQVMSECAALNGRQNDRDHFTWQVVTTLSLLVELGFFHTFNTVNGDHRPNFMEMCHLAPAVMVLLRDEAQAYGTKKWVADWAMVATRNVAIIELFHLFMDCEMSDNITQMVSTYEDFAASHFNAADLQQAEAIFVDALKKQQDEALSSVSPQGLTTGNTEDRTSSISAPHGDEASGAFLNGEEIGISSIKNLWVGLGVPAGEMTGDSCHNLFQYEQDASLWQRRVPWDVQLIESAADQILARRPIFGDLTSLNFTDLCTNAESELPPIVAQMLELITWKDLTLKTCAMKFLIRIFHVRTSFSQAIDACIFICDPVIAAHFYHIRSLLVDLRMHITFLRRNMTDADALVEDAFASIAFQRVSTILSTFTEMVQHIAPERDRLHSLQFLLVDLGVLNETFAVLRLPWGRKSIFADAGKGCRTGDVLLNAQAPTLLQMAFAFLEMLVLENGGMQAMLLEHNDLFLSYMDVSGLSVETLFAAMVRNNLDHIQRHGKEWCDRVFENVMRGRHFDTAQLSLISALAECNGQAVKEVQDYVRSKIQSNRSLEALLAQNHIEDPCEVDLDLERLKIETQGNWLLLLACISNSKDPAATVFAERFVSIEWLIGSFLLIPDSWNSSVVGNRWKFALLTCVIQIYLHAESTRNLDQVKVLENGFWTLEGEEYEECQHCSPVIPTLLLDLRSLRHSLQQDANSRGHLDAVNDGQGDKSSAGKEIDRRQSICSSVSSLGDNKGEESLETRLMTDSYVEMILTALLLIRNYYKLPPFAVPERSKHLLVKEKLLFELERIRTNLHCEQVFTKMTSERLSSLRTRVAGTISALSPPAIINHDSSDFVADVDKKDAETFNLPPGYPNPGTLDVTRRLTRTLHTGFKKMSADVSEYLVNSEIQSALPLILSRDARAPICKGIEPKYACLLLDMMPILKTSTDEGTLCEMLAMLRGCIYLDDPQHPFREPESYEDKWRAFLDLTAVPISISAGGARQLEWVQNKFNTIGCTTAAVRLIGHRSKSVQVQAMGLLLVLLQGSNRVVQDTLARALKSPKNNAFLVTISDVLDSTIQSFKDYKRKVRPKAKGTSNNAFDISTKDSLTALKSREDLTGIGRTSRVMLTLRLLQLMCARQFAPLQDVMRLHANKTSGNTLKQMLTLFSSTQALMNEMPQHVDRSPLFLLSLQLLDTITECLMGPNIRIQKEILTTHFFFDINRIFSSCYYSGIEPGNLWTSATLSSKGTSSMNPLRSAIKLSALKCCLAFFDTVTDAEIPEELLGFFDARNIVSQILATAQLMGFLNNRQLSRHTKYGSLTASHFAGAWRKATLKDSQGPAGNVDCSQSIQSSSFEATNAASLTETDEAEEVETVTRQLSTDSRFKDTYHALRLEVSKFYILLQNFAAYDSSGNIADMLEHFSREHALIDKYLRSHTLSVDVLRLMNRSSWSDSEEAIVGNEHKNQHVQNVRFELSEHMVQLVERSHFKLMWEDFLRSLPRDSADEMFPALITKIQVCDCADGVPLLCLWVKLTYAMVSDGKLTQRDMQDIAALSTLTQYLAEQSGVMRMLLKRRQTLRLIPLYISLVLTLLLLCVYSIPMDPNSGDVLGGGRWYPAPWAVRGPGGYEESATEPYRFANATSDADYAAQTRNVVHESDLSLKFRLKMMTRWQSVAEWEYQPFWRIILRVLTVLHSLSCIVTLFMCLVLDVPLMLWKELEEAGGYSILTGSIGRENPKVFAMQPSATAHRQKAVPNDRVKKVSKQQTVQMRKAELEHMEPPKAYEMRTALMLHPRNLKMCWQLFKKFGRAMYLMFLVSMSIMGVLDSPFYTVACNIDYLFFSFGRIVTSVLAVGIPRLARTYQIGILFLAACGFFSYANYSQIAIHEDQSCHTLFQCVMKHIFDAFRGDMTTVLGQFGAWTFPALMPWLDIWHTGRSFFLLAGLVFWNLFLQPVMHGQIVDAFAEIRQETEAVAEHLRDKCIITGIERQHFAKYPQEWEDRKDGAYALRYLLFFLSLLERDNCDYNGLENSVIEEIERSSYGFFPVGVFSREAGKGGTTGEKLREQDSSVSQQLQAVDSVDSLLAELNDLKSEVGEVRSLVQQHMSMMKPLLVHLQSAPVTTLNEGRELRPPLPTVGSAEEDVEMAPQIPPLPRSISQ